tara:strand:- start:112 stop:315 length:204 start_codon:yes stop_codon:yes gene_type:complete
MSIIEQSKKAFKNILNFTPWVISIYIFYLLDTNLWTYETPHRGKISVIIMSLGMIISLIIASKNNSN